MCSSPHFIITKFCFVVLGQLFGVFFVVAVCLFYLTATGYTIVLDFQSRRSLHSWEIPTYATFCELSKQCKTKPQNNFEEKPLHTNSKQHKQG